MNEGQFFLAVAAMLPALYYTMKLIVWFSDKMEEKNEKK
tara:strand:+ start:483 stop:599 length:117 start_codon:yes stop_codon:yes gene_type:complete